MVFESYIVFLNKVLFFGLSVAQKSSFPKPLTRDDEARYLRIMHGEIVDSEISSTQAREILIKHNLRLVAHVTKKYNGSAEADDLLSMGCIGLIKAINTFKIDKGVQISTYAARCIENEILMSLRMNKKHSGVASLDATSGSGVDDGDDLAMVDIMTDDRPDQIEIAEHGIMMKKLVKVMKQRLSEREYKIISLRYGIENNIALPQRMVAKQMNISRSYISRIEKRGIEIVRQIVKEHAFDGALD